MTSLKIQSLTVTSPSADRLLVEGVVAETAEPADDSEYVAFQAQIPKKNRAQFEAMTADALRRAIALLEAQLHAL